MAEKMRKGERVAIITRLLCEHPNQLLSLTELSSRLGAAKSTISEDVAAIRDGFSSGQLGPVETVSGASGGVKWIPGGGSAWQEQITAELCRQLADPKRILPGGYLYTTDLCTDSRQVERYAQVFAGCFADREPNVVLTVETRGIPLAYATARYLGVPLAVARKELPIPMESMIMRQERSEGPTMNINYVSGSNQRVQTMALPRRSVPQAARALIIDDFMRAGGTARGLEQLMQEFGATTVGCGVLVTTAKPEKKLIDSFLALACLEEVDEQTPAIKVSPGRWFDSR